MTSTSPFSACTPSHCTWGELGQMYSSAPFLTGLAVIAVAVVIATISHRRGMRWVKWTLILGLIVAGFIGMHMHPATS